MVNVSDLNRNVSPWVNRAREGRRVTVMKDSVPVAQLVGIDQMRYLDLLERNAEAAAAAIPDPAGDPTAPALSDLTPRLGQTSIGITASGEEICLDLNRHYLAIGSDATEVAALLSAMIAGAEPATPTEFIVGTANPTVTLVHRRRRTDIPTAVEPNLEIATIAARFAEQLTGELASRDALLRAADVNSIADYRAQNPDTASTAPDLIVVLDQADLVVEHLDAPTLTTLLRRGDRYGIHLWLIARTLKGLEHLPLPTSRLTTRLDSRNVSRKILETPEAVALGYGRALLCEPMATSQILLARPDHSRSSLRPERGTTGWGPRLNAPVTLAEADLQRAPDSSELGITLGVTDPPREPYVIRPSNLGGNILVLGQRGSGVTTAITTLIASTGFSYTPADCSFFIIDSDTKQDLTVVNEFPNIAGYARLSDVDIIERMLAILCQELNDRDQVPESDFTGDDYPRHSMVVISDWEVFASSASAEQLRKLHVLLDHGPRAGIYVVIAARSAMQIPVKLQSYFGVTVHLRVEDVSASGYLSASARALAREIPADQPGRCVDIRGARAARIAYPSLSSMSDTEPDPDGLPALVQALRAAHPEQPPAARIPSVATVIEEAEVWKAFTPDAAKPAWVPLWQPIGVSAETLQIATAGDHILAVGDPQSGKTNLMRTLINNVVRQLGPEDAQFVILDSSGDLSDVGPLLERHGMLLGYAMNREAADQIVAAKVRPVIEGRVLTADTPVNKEIMDHRSWWSGPDIFVIVDDATAFNSGIYGGGSSSTLAQLISLHTRLGLHVYATSPARTYIGDQRSVPLVGALAAPNATAIYLSGKPAYGTVHAGTDIRFTQRRPGHGVLLDWDTGTQQVVQTSLSAPWSDGGIPRGYDGSLLL
ncbi:hypothetical protein BKG82_27635 [Mycobacteroides chelonae]|uniref:FtsK domain-containing protein n=2 Tax=Mycobacteroides chelonae TaxID=1774 RepID=A0A1S1LCJ6_MYCCH|nr:hypothetical protein BKG82_27635 [Mycobacteroides chelonae]